MLATCHRIKIRILAHGKEPSDVNFAHDHREFLQKMKCENTTCNRFHISITFKFRDEILIWIANNLSKLH